MLVHEPDTLMNLAADSFGDYIIMVAKDWLLTTTSLNIEWMKWFSGNVYEGLGNVLLPSQVANDVSMRLLKLVDKWIGPKGIRRSDGPYSLAMSYLTSALIHPAVTHLDFLETDTFYVYRRADTLLSQVVSPMTMLKVLRLQRLPNCVDELSFPNLQELTLLRKSTDELLKLLLVTCSKIRKLDVANSKGITDRGIQFLLKFTHLENLNIRDTKISDNGLTQLLMGLSTNRDSDGFSLLKSFGCTYLNDKQLEVLTNKFQKLIVLEVVNCYSRKLLLFRNFKYLKRFTSFCSLLEFPSLLESVGHQLSHLKLGIWDADVVCCISKFCPSLIYLNLNYEWDLDDLSEITPLPSFKSLKFVDLKFRNTSNLMASILSYCTNVKVLKISCEDTDTNAVATAMMQNNPLIHLEELHWWAETEPLLPEVGRKIVSQCKNLRSMYGNIWWSRRRSQKPWFVKYGVSVTHFWRVHPRLI